MFFHVVFPFLDWPVNNLWKKLNNIFAVSLSCLHGQWKCPRVVSSRGASHDHSSQGVICMIISLLKAIQSLQYVEQNENFQATFVASFGVQILWSSWQLSWWHGWHYCTQLSSQNVPEGSSICKYEPNDPRALPSDSIRVEIAVRVQFIGRLVTWKYS